MLIRKASKMVGVSALRLGLLCGAFASIFLIVRQKTFLAGIRALDMAFHPSGVARPHDAFNLMFISIIVGAIGTVLLIAFGLSLRYRFRTGASYDRLLGITALIGAVSYGFFSTTDTMAARSSIMGIFRMVETFKSAAPHVPDGYFATLSTLLSILSSAAFLILIVVLTLIMFRERSPGGVFFGVLGTLNGAWTLVFALLTPLESYSTVENVAVLGPVLTWLWIFTMSLYLGFSPSQSALRT